MADDDFAVSRSTSGTTEVVHVTGEVDWATAPEIERALDAARAAGGAVVADYSGVTFMDSTGLSVLVKTRNQLSGEGRAFAVCATEFPVRSVFEISGVIDLLGLCGSLDAALAAVAA